MPFVLSLALLLASVTSAVAQTWTSCDPLNRTCPADPALGTSHTWNFNQTLDDKIWSVTNGVLNYSSDGAEFTIAKRLQSPTVKSKFYIWFGIVESHVKMSPGAGIVSSVVLESDDLDEVDWEWVGADTNGVQTNYYGKGVLDYNNGGKHVVENAASEFHNYTTYWTQEKLEWYVDGNLIRTLNYDDADGGQRYPQTPCTVRYGIWPAGDPSNPKGTIEWAGGVVDYDAGPYTMVVQSVSVHDFHSGKEYVYTGHSGSFDSIKVVKGNSTASLELNKVPPETLHQKWNNLSSSARIGIICGASAFGGIVLVAFLIFVFRQRRKGRLEHALMDAKWKSERAEMENHQSNWRHGGYQQVA